MYKKILIASICILVIVILFIFIDGYNTYKSRNEITYMDVDYYLALPALEDAQDDVWYKKYNIIAHACGGIDGLNYTNSKEAIENTLNNNVNLIEIDFEVTSDGKLVCYHATSDISFPEKESFSFEEFKQQKIQGKYTPLTGKDIFDYMKNNPNLYIIIDTKSENYLNVIQMIVNEAEKDLLDRFIVQCYHPGDKEKIANIYSFPEENYLFTSYMFTTDQIYALLKVCMDENIKVLVVPFDPVFYTPEVVEMYTSKNIYVYFHTINRLDIAEYLFDIGASGIYTDFLYSID